MEWNDMAFKRMVYLFILFTTLFPNSYYSINPSHWRSKILRTLRTILGKSTRMKKYWGNLTNAREAWWPSRRWKQLIWDLGKKEAEAQEFLNIYGIMCSDPSRFCHSTTLLLGGLNKSCKCNDAKVGGCLQELQCREYSVFLGWPSRWLTWIGEGKSNEAQW